MFKILKKNIGKAWVGPYLTCLAKRCSIHTLMFMPVIVALLTRNERLCAVNS